MKILFLLSSYDRSSGWGRYGYDLAHAAHRTGMEVVCVAAENGSKDNSDTIQIHTILTAPLSCVSNPVRVFASARRLQYIISEYRPDVIHVIAEPYVHLLPFVRARGARCILTAHGTYSYMPALTHGIKRLFTSLFTYLAFRKVDSIIAVSNFTRQHILRHKPGVDSKTTVVTNWVDDDFIAEAKSTQAEKNGRTILFVGALKERKGVKEILEALALYKKTYKNPFHFSVVGVGENPYAEKLKLQAEKLGIADSITWHGKVDEETLRNLYASANLFVLTSLPLNAFEGFGLVYLEAAAFGVPSIGSRESGAEDAIKGGETGYLVDPYDKKEVASRIHHILDKQVINSDRCCAWARENTLSKKVPKIFAHYRNI